MRRILDANLFDPKSFDHTDLTSAPQTRCALGPASIFQSAVFAEAFTTSTNSICKSSTAGSSTAKLIAEFQTARLTPTRAPYEAVVCSLVAGRGRVPRVEETAIRFCADRRWELVWIRHVYRLCMRRYRSLSLDGPADRCYGVI
jgi:hypothetical protein